MNQQKVRFELIDGYAKVLTIMVNDGWKIVNTFPNPNPQPYFFALMSIEGDNVDDYNIENVKRYANGNAKYLNQWTP